jgi:hypothetical protein
LVKGVALAVKSITLYLLHPPTKDPPTTFWETIRVWGNTWMWDNLFIKGDLDWISTSIADNSFVVVLDGSYMKETYPHLNSAAFLLEFSNACGRLLGSFVGYASDAGSYHGELLGLMEIHLILQGINKVCKGMQRSVHILLDCLGALDKVENLLPYGIPTQCTHSDILKNIMVKISATSCSPKFSLASKLTKMTTQFAKTSRAVHYSIAKWTIIPRRLYGTPSMTLTLQLDASP